MIKMKKAAWTIVFALILILYYLSSVPSIGVLPFFRQINNLFRAYDTSVVSIAEEISSRAPQQLSPARTLLSDFYQYTLSNPGQVEFLLRKSAHVFMFFIITLAIFFLLRQYFQSGWVTIGGAFILGSILAVLDELHQTTVPGRSGNIVDVGIDIIGVSLAVFFILIALTITKRQKT